MEKPHTLKLFYAIKRRELDFYFHMCNNNYSYVALQFTLLRRVTGEVGRGRGEAIRDFVALS